MLAIMMAVAPPAALPAAERTHRFDVAAQPAASGLPEIARQADVQILVGKSAVLGKRIEAVRGTMRVEEALRRALAGTGLAFATGDRRTYTVSPPAADPGPERPDEAAEAAEAGESEIVITGTHIAGAPVASPVIEIRQQAMREAGQRDLGEVIRSIPNNYTGGQNPGSRFQTGNNNNTNVSGSSAFNLRGLGPDATLTLINGRRLAYDSDSQAVDVSAIPLSAVSAIQIVPDGASAVYGSDAVAGVANVILKRDDDGLTAAARLGAATGGGAFQQAYEAAGGSRWGSGGFLIAAEYVHQGAVRSDQRDYTDYVVRPNTLLDAARHHGALVTAHQRLGGGLTFSVDALYSRRRSRGAEYSSLDFIATTRSANESYAVSPTLRLELPNGWTAALNGFAGANRTHRFDDFIDRVSGENLGTEAFFNNASHGAEMDLDGRLARIAGGDIRAAFGAGYRRNRFERIVAGDPFVQGGSRGNHYGFAELSVPLVSRSNRVRLVDELTVSAAVRHEEYQRFGGVTTPKIGLVYAPARDIRLKVSWGRSFKAPTLLQQFRNFDVRLQRPGPLGGTGYPADATVLVTTGGNPDLAPERARTLSATVELRPRFAQGLELSATWFDVDYTGRVVQPLMPPFAALSNPALAEYIDYGPTAAEQAAVIARARRGLLNTLRVPYDPAKVVAIANGALINAASQRLRGADLRASYRIAVGRGEVALSGFGSWLSSRQRNSPTAPVVALAGTNFNPPRFRARGGATGRFGRLTAAAFVNHIGRLSDTSFTPARRGEAMTTADLTLIWRLPEGRELLKGVEMSVSAQNIADVRPPYLEPFDETAVNYDSTNHSPLGRFVSFTLRKRW